MLPEGWQVMSLGKLATLERGRFSARPRNDPQFFGGVVPFIQTGDVANAGLLLRSYTQTLNEKGLRVSKVFPEGTIFMTIAANIGATAISTFPVACPDSVVAIRPVDGVADLYWLKYALAGRQPDLDAMAGQNAQKNINLQGLQPFELHVPPIQEQRRISGVLSTWDEAIRTAEQLALNAETHRRALVERLVLRPTHGGVWPMRQIAAVATRVQRQVTGEADLPVLMISSATGFLRQDQKYSRYMAGKSVENYIALEEGEFAYNKGNSKRYEFGCVYPLKNLQRGLVPHVYVCFRLHNEHDAGFFEHLFAADYLHDQLGSLVNTGVRNNGLLNIRPADFMACQVPVPPRDEQLRIAAQLAVAAEWARRQEDFASHLREEKAALMADLLTGKRRVRVPAAENTT